MNNSNVNLNFINFKINTKIFVEIICIYIFNNIKQKILKIFQNSQNSPFITPFIS